MKYFRDIDGYDISYDEMQIALEGLNESSMKYISNKYFHRRNYRGIIKLVIGLAVQDKYNKYYV